MGTLSRFFARLRRTGPASERAEGPSRVVATRSDPSRVRRIVVFEGNLTEAPADAICTSTNPRLSLSAGTGGVVREKGGWEIKRECEAIVARSGRVAVAVGSAHRTGAGRLPYRAVIHCVASDSSHHSSPEIVRSCVERALGLAAEIGCRSLAMPVLATGHAALPLEQSLGAIAGALRETVTGLEEVVIVVNDRDRAGIAAARLASAFEEAR